MDAVTRAIQEGRGSGRRRKQKGVMEKDEI